MAHWGCLQCPRTFSTDVDNGRFMAAFDTLLKIAPGFSYAVESPGAWVTGGAFLCESTQAACCSLSNGERRVRVVWADLARPGALGHRVHRRVHLIEPQQSTGLILILLRDDLPALIAQQRHKQPTRCIPYPPRVHSEAATTLSWAASPPCSQPRAMACWCRARRLATRHAGSRRAGRRWQGHR